MLKVTLERLLQGGKYGKSVKMLQNIARAHMKEYRPKRYQELKEINYLEIETLKAAKKAHKEIRELRDAGYQNHEAEEVVLQKYILLPPEKEVIEEMEREE